METRALLHACTLAKALTADLRSNKWGLAARLDRGARAPRSSPPMADSGPNLAAQSHAPQKTSTTTALQSGTYWSPKTPRPSTETTLAWLGLYGCIAPMMATKRGLGWAADRPLLTTRNQHSSSKHGPRTQKWPSNQSMALTQKWPSTKNGP